MSTVAADSPVSKLQPDHVFDVTSLLAELRNALNGKRRNKGGLGHTDAKVLEQTLCFFLVAKTRKDNFFLLHP